MIREGNNLTEKSLCLSFDTNDLLPLLFGEQDKHLLHIEKKTGICTHSRGNVIHLNGHSETVFHVKNILEQLYARLKQGGSISMTEIDVMINKASQPKSAVLDKKSLKSDSEGKLLQDDVVIKTIKKHIRPYTEGQKYYIKQLFAKDIVFGMGPAGTGKTYLAVAAGVARLLNHEVERLILSRPAVEAGEKLGYLPGDMKDKVDPYLQPLYDALHDMLPAEKVARMIEQKIIAIAPLAFMRGRTLTHSHVILDEAQNVTAKQMKMFLTRLGEGSRMVISGDHTQVDLPRGEESGLTDAVERLANIEEIAIVRFQNADVVRHPLTAKIISAYE